MAYVYNESSELRDSKMQIPRVSMIFKLEGKEDEVWVKPWYLICRCLCRDKECGDSGAPRSHILVSIEIPWLRPPVGGKHEGFNWWLEVGWSIPQDPPQFLEPPIRCIHLTVISNAYT